MSHRATAGGTAEATEGGRPVDGVPSRSPASAAFAASRLPAWRKALPFALGSALVFWVVSRLDVSHLLEHLARTNYVALLSFALVTTLLLMSADSAATVAVYRRTLAPISFHQFFVIRAASYLPSLLNYNLGQAWIVYFMSKAYRVPLGRVTGATLLTYATTLGCLVLFGLCALPFNLDRLPWLPTVLVVAAVLGALYLGVVAMAPRFMFSWPATAPLVEIGVGGHLVALLYRVPHMVVLFLGTWLPFWFFDIHIPLAHALASMPPVMLVAALPVTPQGIGTRDVIAAQLFSAYAVGSLDERRAAIAAATLSWAGALTLVQLVISPLFMRRARRLMADLA